MWGKFKEHFTEDARYWYKLWSSWMALAWGGIVYALVEDPTVIGQALGTVPEPYKSLVPGVAFAFASALPILVRCLKQGSLKKPPPQ